MKRTISVILAVCILLGIFAAIPFTFSSAAADDIAPAGASGAYYLVGNSIGWGANKSYQFTLRKTSPPEYVLCGIPITPGEYFKVYDGKNYYPIEGGCYGPFDSNASGLYDFYFCPDGNGSFDYYYGYLKAVSRTCSHPEMDYYPEVPATASADGNREYYQCKNCGKYFFMSRDGSTLVPATEYETIIHQAPEDDACAHSLSFRAGYPATESSPGMYDYCVCQNCGRCFVYRVYPFPEHYNEVFESDIIIPVIVPETQAPTQADHSDPAATEPKSTITVYFTDILGWGGVNIYYWLPVTEPYPYLEWPGIPMSEYSVDPDGNTVYCVEVPSFLGTDFGEFEAGVIFCNPDGTAQTEDITNGENIHDGEIRDGSHWRCSGKVDFYTEIYKAVLNEPLVKPTQAPTQVSTEPAPTEPVTAPAEDEGGYYLTSSYIDWKISDSYKLEKTYNTEFDEYAITYFILKEENIKVVHSSDGETIDAWYPDGMGNAYGENGEITENGVYNIYFRPDMQGDEGWFEGCIYVADMCISTEPVTEPVPTEAAIILGDANGDGDVDAVDSTIIQRVATMVKVPYSEEQLMCADVDGDGELTVLDATYILRYSSHVKTPYPVGEIKQ